MPKTAAERQARRREKMKERGEYEAYKKRNVEEQRRSRLRKREKEEKLSKTCQKKLWTERCRRNRERVARCRSLKKQRAAQSSSPSPTKSPFQSAKAFGKAVSRANRALNKALPSTPRRQKAVCRALIRKRLTEAQPSPSSSPTVKSKPPIGDETSDLVRNFYERDDISRQAPGRRDSVTIRKDDGTKERRQVRHLTSSIKEVYALFIKEYPHIRVGKSKFADLRPKHVLLCSKLPHNVCLCKYHENFILAVDALHKVCPDFPSYSHELPESFLCQPPSRNCWVNECDTCKDGSIFNRLFFSEEAVMTTWYAWKKDESGKVCKVMEEGTTQELREYICLILPQFLEHCYIKRQQAAMYQEERKAAESHLTRALLQVDFSENYTCQHQDEIQSAHWQQSQVSLFTAAVWYNGELHSKVITSDNLTHSKDTVIAYVDTLLEDIPSQYNEVSIWTDGPASQFKNRYIAASIPVLEKKHNVTIHWNFFATSHGKGPVDGIGGSVKRQAWMAVKNRHALVTNAASFTDAVKLNSSVEVIEVTSSDIDRRNKSLNISEVFTNAPPVSGITSSHHMRVIDGNVHTFLLTKDAATLSSEKVLAGVNAIAANDWCVVDYEGELFPGVVTAVCPNDNFEVSVMVRAGAYWKWPTKEDKIHYKRDKIQRKLKAPVLVNAREHYNFADF